MTENLYDWRTPDWSREAPSRFWEPGRKLLRSIRDYQRLSAGGAFARFRAGICVLRYRFWSAVAGADIPLTASIDGGLLMPHPNGVVVHAGAKIGANCLLFQQATLGVVQGKAGAPELGCHVDVGAGAKILGPVKIGDGALIGANAVVVDDVPERGVATGGPARIIRIRSVEEAYAPPS